MTRHRKMDPAAVLDKSLRFFWRYGYEGTTIDNLVLNIGIERPSLYRIFGSKEALYIRSLEQYHSAYLSDLDRAFSAKTAHDVASDYLKAYARAVTRRGLPHGCMAVNCTLGGLTTPHAAKVYALNRRLDAETKLAVRFDRAIYEGDLTPLSSPSAMAGHVIDLCCGLAVQAKAGSKRDRLLSSISVGLTSFYGERRSSSTPRPHSEVHLY